MSFLMLSGIAVALGMDAFAVAVATGVKLCRTTFWQTARMAGAFGVFQGLMTLLGWLGAQTMARKIGAYDHWVAFGLLVVVGIHMVWESFRGGEGHWKSGDPTKGWILLVLALATSIDALAVGISFSALHSAIVGPSLLIAGTAAVMTVGGLKLGCRFGLLLGERMELVGGLVLIAIGIKILLGH